MNLFIVTTLFLSNLSIAQVGIGTQVPNSTLDVRGSLQTAFKEITASTTLGVNDYYVTYNGTAAVTPSPVVTLPIIATGTSSYNGRIYRIKNVSTQNVRVQASGSNTIRATNVPVNSFIVNPGCYVEIVNNTNTGENTANWDLSYTAQPYAPNVSLYGATLKIPPHTTTVSNHNTILYDSGTGTDIWWLISNSSTTFTVSGTNIKPSKMTLVYEYQGTGFDLTNLHPLLTVGNTSSYPDVFTVSFGGFTTVANKTRLTLTVSRVDFIGTETTSNSNWLGGEFFVNALFTKKVF